MRGDRHGYPSPVGARTHPLIFWPLALVVVIGGACLLAPPVYHALLDLGWIDVDPWVPSKTFLKVFRRLLLGGLAVSFFWWFRPWRQGLLRYGLTPVRPRLKLMVVPFLVMTVVLFLVLAAQFALGWLVWEEPLRIGKFAGRIARYAGVGLLIGCLEEWFFRGWMGEFAAKKHGPRLAVIMPALAYAVVHAFRPTALNVPVTHDAAGALDALGGWVAFLLDIEAFGPACLGLFLFALLLTALYRRSGSLWPAIGAHAGAIMVLFSYGALTERWPARTWGGTRLLYDGPLVWVILALATWRLWPRGAGRDDPDSATPPAARAG